MADILVVEDAEAIREGLKALLESEFHTVRTASDGVAALAQYSAKRPDLVVLDVMLPGKSGYDVCREIRKEDGETAILMLSAKSDEAAKVLGLGLGADDYLGKPFGARELVARIEAVRRRGRHAKDGVMTFRFGSGVVRGRELVFVNRQGRRVDLTAREFALLQLFAAHPDEVLSREALLGYGWGSGCYAHTRTLDTRICSLRKKIKGCGWMIDAVIGQGYRVNCKRETSGL